jgi:anti-anti-sigma regulatory factor
LSNEDREVVRAAHRKVTGVDVVDARPIITEAFPDCTRKADCQAFLQRFRLLLFNTYRPVVVLDMSHSPQMNAAGIELLLNCITEVTRRDGELKLAAPSAQTELILELTQLTGIVERFGTVDQARASLEIRPDTQPGRTAPAP